MFGGYYFVRGSWVVASSPFWCGSITGFCGMTVVFGI